MGPSPEKRDSRYVAFAMGHIHDVPGDATTSMAERLSLSVERYRDGRDRDESREDNDG